MEECVGIEDVSLLPPFLMVQSGFLGFPKHVFAILYKGAMSFQAVIDKIFFASKAFVAEFAHNWWGREGLASCF